MSAFNWFILRVSFQEKKKKTPIKREKQDRKGKSNTTEESRDTMNTQSNKNQTHEQLNAQHVMGARSIGGSVALHFPTTTRILAHK